MFHLKLAKVKNCIYISKSVITYKWKRERRGNVIGREMFDRPLTTK